MRDALADFFRLESAGGICLVAAAVLAMVVANSPLVVFYDLIFSTAFEVRLGDFGIAKPLLLWVNDGLMAVFFFLVGLAIFDDLGAIIIIAIFYTANVSLTVLAVASLCHVALLGLNRRGVTELTPYLLIGLIMWTAVLKSGVHATLAGVALALFIPMRDPNHPERSPVRDLEHDLHTAVAFGILPIFAFVLGQHSHQLPLESSDSILESMARSGVVPARLDSQLNLFDDCDVFVLDCGDGFFTCANTALVTSRMGVRLHPGPGPVDRHRAPPQYVHAAIAERQQQ